MAYLGRQSLSRETKEVTQYSLKVGDVDVTIWDSPGLQDGLLHDDLYLADIKRKCTDIDLVIYCIRMSETRFTRDCADLKSMQLLTAALGSTMWRNAIFVLTYGNDVIGQGEAKYGDDTLESRRHFVEKLSKWVKLLHSRLQEEVNISKEVAEGVVVVPAGHINKLHLPNSNAPEYKSFWLSEVWLKALFATKSRAQPALIKLNLHRIKTQADQYEDKEDAQLQVLAMQPLIFANKGEELGQELNVNGANIAGSIAGIIGGVSASMKLLLELADKNAIITPEDIEPELKG